MKKRVLAALLCAAMVVTTLVGCTGPANTPSENPGSETGSEPGSEPGSEAGSENSGTADNLSVKPVVYYPFESTDEGWKVVVADGNKAANNAYDVANVVSGAARTIVYGDMALAQIKEGGVKGNTIFMNRDYALDLNFQPTKTTEYSVSFWVCAGGMSDFAPTLQFGSNIAYADNAGNEVAWANFTAGHGQPFPIIWSRNEVFDGDGGVDCWPWMYPVKEPGIRGYKEWAMITLVVTGEEQDSPNAGVKTVGAKMYVNDKLVYDSQDNYMNETDFAYTWDCTLAPDLMNPTATQTFEAYFGINYLDNMYKGYLDEFYLFDKAITEDDVKALYAMGNPTNPPELDSEGDPVENKRVILGQNGDYIGFNDYTTGWWSAFSNIWDVPEGQTKTVSFKGYHTNLSFANHMNPVVILQSTATGHSGDAANAAYAEGYAEYAVVRTDNYGWLGALNTNANLAELGWVLESDWNWDTFKDDTHGASYEVSVTNHGTTADIVIKLTTADGATVHTQAYKNIAVNGPLYFCLTCEKSCLDEIKVVE